MDCIFLNGPQFSVSLYSMWLFLEYCKFGPNNVVCLEIRFSQLPQGSHALIFNIWPPKGKKKKRKVKNEGEKIGPWLFKSPGSHFMWQERSFLQRWEGPPQWLLIFVRTSVIRSSNQSPDSPFLEDRVFLSHPSICNLCASCWNACRATVHVAGGRHGSCYCSNSWSWLNWLKGRQFTISGLPQWLQAFNRLQNCSISQILPV